MSRERRERGAGPGLWSLGEGRSVGYCLSSASLRREAAEVVRRLEGATTRGDAQVVEAVELEGDA